MPDTKIPFARLQTHLNAFQADCDIVEVYPT